MVRAMTVGNLILHLQHAGNIYGMDTVVQMIDATGSIEGEVAAERKNIHQILSIFGDTSSAIVLTGIAEQKEV